MGPPSRCSERGSPPRAGRLACPVGAGWGQCNAIGNGYTIMVGPSHALWAALAGGTVGRRVEPQGVTQHFFETVQDMCITPLDTSSHRQRHWGFSFSYFSSRKQRIDWGLSAHLQARRAVLVGIERPVPIAAGQSSVIPPHPPSPFSRRFNRDVEGTSAERQSRQLASRSRRERRRSAGRPGRIGARPPAVGPPRAVSAAAELTAHVSELGTWGLGGRREQHVVRMRDSATPGGAEIGGTGGFMAWTI